MGTFRYTRAARFYSRMHLTFLCLLAGHRDIRCVVMISKLSQTDRDTIFTYERMLFSSPVSSRVCVKNSAHPYGKEKSRKGKHNRSLPIQSPLFFNSSNNAMNLRTGIRNGNQLFFRYENCYKLFWHQTRVKYTFDFSRPINVRSNNK